MNESLISKTWFMDPPYDSEYKYYLIMGYLQKVDSSFIKKRLSPHFLYMREMMSELILFQEKYSAMKRMFDKERYIYFNQNEKLEGENNEIITDIYEIVEYSIPQIDLRITFGEKILKKNSQILYL